MVIVRRNKTIVEKVMCVEWGDSPATFTYSKVGGVVES